MGDRIEVFIPGLVTSTPNGSHGHWSAAHRRAKSERAAAWAHTLKRLVLVKLPVVVTFVRCSPRELDDDNLVISFKHCRDGVADVFGINDRDRRVTWRYEQSKCPKMQAGTRIRIERRAA